MIVKIFWKVEFNQIDNNTIKGFDLVEVSRDEYKNIYDIADAWLDDCINEKIARAEYYPKNELRLSNFFNTINISSGIMDFKITKVSLISPNNTRTKATTT